MRPLLLFIILFPLAVKGQDLTKVSQINLRYNVGHYNFGDTGYYAREEIIQFIPVSKEKFVRTYYLVTKRYVANPATGQNNLSINDTLKDNSNRTFSFDIFQEILNNLNSTKDNFGKENLFKKILYLRNEKKLKTIITCNYDPSYSNDFEKGLDEFGIRYDGRIYDRLFSDFNFIESRGKSLRD